MTHESLAVVNARVWTNDSRRPWADALITSRDRIAAIGSGAEIRKLAGPDTRLIDAAGRLVVPGFNDAHVHFLDGGASLASVQLRDARTRAGFTRRIGAHARTLPEGAWMLEGNWDHHHWGGELPRRDWIDAVTPRTPVFVQRLDGHMALANSVALRAADITRDTPDVPGGEIVRDEHGEPTGVLKDNALALVRRVIPAPLPAQEDAALDAAMAHVASHGVTSVQHMGTWAHVAVFERAHRAGRLRTRVCAMVPIAAWERLRDELAARESRRGDAWFRLGGLKGFMDGSLGSHTAAMLAPYSDDPANAGLFVTPPDEMYGYAEAADRAGLHLVIHAIGDRANRELLDIYERIARGNPARSAAQRRPRIEHAQHLHPSDVARFAPLGVVASMQPYHAIDDGRWAEPVIGAGRAKGAYPFRSLRDAGARLAFGSDWFVAPPVPLEGIFAAVTRRTLDGGHPEGWVPEQTITVEDALRAYTSGSAYAEFQEHEKGTLARGMLADFVIIDRDITRIPADEIRDARVDLTVAGGIVVYERT